MRQALINELQFREIDPNDYELLLSLDESLQAKTVPEHVVQSLPTQVLESALELEDCCAVCLDHFEQGQVLKFLPSAPPFEPSSRFRRAWYTLPSSSTS